MQKSKLGWNVASLLAMIILLGSLLFIYPNTDRVNAVEQRTLNTITVSGEGEITINPDVAYVQIGLVTEGKTAQEAQSQNATLFTKIKDALKAKGIKDEDMKTIQFSTHPRYDWEKEKNVLKGYQVEHMLQVTYHDIEHIGDLLDAVTASGANRIHHIQFGTEKQEEYERAALEKALENAEEKANALAKKAGKQVKGIIQINESGVTAPPVYRGYEAMKGMSESSSADTQISQGTLKVQSTLQVTFEF
jgi:uncharacterized protein YggE